MSFDALAAMLHTPADSGALTALPYAQLLGLQYRRNADGIRIEMPFSKQLTGAPGRLHGGTVAGLLEIASIAQLIHVLGEEARQLRIKPINVTVDYLRAAACETTTASAVIARLGRRIANIRAEAWQADRGTPVAAAHMNVMLVRN